MPFDMIAMLPALDQRFLRRLPLIDGACFGSQRI
jgi:hypothetical protein